MFRTLTDERGPMKRMMQGIIYSDETSRLSGLRVGLEKERGVFVHRVSPNHASLA